MRWSNATYGFMRMVDVTGKDRTVRVATADGYVQTTTTVVDLITGNDTPEARCPSGRLVAAIMAVKRTPDLIPLCHPISIAGLMLTLPPAVIGSIFIVPVKTTDRTGVEMEALTAVCAAGLTVIDMIKGVDPDAPVAQGFASRPKRAEEDRRWSRMKVDDTRSPTYRARSHAISDSCCGGRIYA